MATAKQIKTAKIIIQKGGNVVDVGPAMIEGGYSAKTAKTPKKLTKSQGWKQLMAAYLPDLLLAERHNELLNKRDSQGKIETNAITQGLAMAYKLKGYFPKEHGTAIQINLSQERERYA